MVYILKTPIDNQPNKFEFRVTHAQAIENIYFGDIEDKGYDPEYVVSYFQNAPVFENFADASQHAFNLGENILKSDFPVLEYGIQSIELPHSFKFYKKQKTNKKNDI